VGTGGFISNEFNFLSFRTAQTIRGVYPEAYVCFKSLQDDQVVNEGLAFDRHFAMIRGPVGLIFLVYKTDAVGLVNPDFTVTLSKEFQHLKEVTEELNVFKNVQ
jgi:hypothetical protein